MEFLIYALLGIVQGLTEFLPVSSSAHLVLLQHWLGVSAPGMTLEVALHVATVISVLVVYGRDLVNLVVERNWRYIGLLLLCCVVTGALFMPFKDQVEAFSDSPQAPRFIGCMLLITGVWQILADWRLKRDQAAGAQPRGLTAMFSILIGVAMACAGLFRGISRSGATIGTAIQLGMAREEAARFSFLSSVPIVLGGGLLKAGEASAELAGGQLQAGPLLVGFICAALTGVAAILLLRWMLAKAQLRWFGFYCLALGLAAILVG